MIVGITSYKTHLSKQLDDVTIRCIDSVSKQNPLETVLIDDSSIFSKELETIIQERNVTLKKVSYRNLSKSWNDLCRYAFYERDQEHIVLLNNDIELKEGALHGLEQHITKHPLHNFVIGREVCGHYYAAFSAFLISRNCWEETGKFEERIPYSFNDGEYTMRMKMKNIAMHLCNDFKLHHEEGSTFKALEKAGELDAELQFDVEKLGKLT